MEYRNKLKELGIEIERTGRQVCPKCSEARKNKKEKCLSVKYDLDGVVYKCHNCQWSGVVFYRDKQEAKTNYKKPCEPKQTDKKQPLYDYFEKRGINKEIVDQYKIGFNEQKEIILPYYKNGELVNVKYRKNLGQGKKTFRQEAETEKTLFGMDEVKDTKELIWVEGEIDVLSFAMAGLNAVSVPQGASEIKLECIENCWDFINSFDTHIIAVDNDNAGDKLKLNLLNRLDRQKCKLLQWGQYKDANEALMNETSLCDYISKADYENPDGVITFFDCIDEILDFKLNGYTKGYSTGWDCIDEKFTIKTGHLMIVSGFPSRGKSFFIDNLLFNLSKQYQLKHLVASFENTNANHFARYSQMYTGKNFADIETLESDEFDKAFEFINSHFYRLRIDRLWNIDQIAEACELAVKKYGIKTLTIDPYNRLSHSFSDREDKYIGGLLSKLCMLSKKLDILIVFIAHPKKPDGEQMPTMYSISGSSDWYNMADYGIIIHRDRNERTGKLEHRPKICVAKVKDFNLGDPSGGTVELVFNGEKHILEEPKWQNT